MDRPHVPARKIGRNELCWCHSGKKYKKCHYERDRAPRKQPWEIAAEYRKGRSDKKYCLHALAGAATCDGQIVKAHSIPRRAALAAISEQGHVYGGDPDFMSIVKNRGRVTLKRFGVGEASTFTGFCAKHDDRTFAALEKQSLIPTDEQCFLMGYRAVCRELFTKQLAHAGTKVLRSLDQGTSMEIQERTQWIADLNEVGTLMGLAEIRHHKMLYDAMLVNGNWGRYRRFVVQFAVVPGVLSSGAFEPEFDFRGQRLQNLLDSPPLRNIAVTILPTTTGGVAVLGWQEDSDPVCIPFVESLASTPRDGLADAIVRLVFEHIENTYSRPSWWESLSKGNRGRSSASVQFDSVAEA